MKMALDEMDLYIVKLLQENAKISANEISKKTGAPIATIYSRIKRLEGNGVIKGYKPILDDAQLGLSTTAFVFATADLSKVDLEANPDYSISEEISKFPQVQEVFIISGAWDYIIKLKESSTEAAGEFILNKLAHVNGLDKNLSCMVFRTIKESLDLPL